MPVTLVKISAPGWEKEFPDLPAAVVELRRHVCAGCLAGRPDEDEPPVDLVVDGVVVECHDAVTLLNTSCGYEYQLEGDHGLWPEEED
ncbi:hypothetical protein G6L37_05465 [Agrobacterium rubi]|nr:hypothetical protein [Agrobacterium rubi]NTF24806.1 hypothetical protein [Agrobacterium rubi]